MHDRSSASPAARAQPPRARASLPRLSLVALVGVFLAAGLLRTGDAPPTGTPPAAASALRVRANFADGTLQGIARGPDGDLWLAEAAPPPEQRPRAYAHHPAVGVYTSAPLAVPMPIGAVEATLDADLPAGSEVVLEVRGQGADGRW